ncbi:catalase-like domain-containing protein [Fomitopsis betulina]|nr:catalase-like domain-containing protein [Fomitopsis betulina]
MLIAAQQDTVRDVRGFATKFYTHEGVQDIVKINTPFSPFRMLLGSRTSSSPQSPSPINKVPQGQTAHNNLWDFVGLQPSRTHGDSTNNSSSNFTGSGSSAVFIASSGMRPWKFVAKALDLEEAIQSGAYPKCKFGTQVIPEANGHDFHFNILDTIKVWPEELVPLDIIGKMVINSEFFPGD